MRDYHALKTALFLAWKNITKSKKTLVIIVLVLSLSFLSITFFAAIIDGLKFTFEEKSINTLTGHVTVEPHNDETYIDNTEATVEKIEKLPQVTGVSSRLEKGATINDGDTQLAGQAMFINPIKEKTTSSFLSSIVEGRTLPEDTTDSVLIGADLVKKYASEDDKKKKLDISTGDIIQISFTNGIKDEFKVRGIYETGSAFSDNYILFNKETYNSIFNKSDISTSIIITLPQRGKELALKQDLIQIGIDEKINPWYTKINRIKQFTASLDITNKITGVIGLLTSFATIYIIIFINVMTKRRQIGILKAVGIEKNIILLSYVIQSMVYGVLGILLGLFITGVFLLYLSYNPLIMPIGEVVPILTPGKILTASVSIFLASIAAGYFPSKKAADENILSAIFGGE